MGCYLLNQSSVSVPAFGSSNQGPYGPIVSASGDCLSAEVFGRNMNGGTFYQNLSTEGGLDYQALYFNNADAANTRTIRFTDADAVGLTTDFIVLQWTTSNLDLPSFASVLATGSGVTFTTSTIVGPFRCPPGHILDCVVWFIAGAGSTYGESLASTSQLNWHWINNSDPAGQRSLQFLCTGTVTLTNYIIIDWDITTHTTGIGNAPWFDGGP
jgi:hypothetical protein